MLSSTGADDTGDDLQKYAVRPARLVPLSTGQVCLDNLLHVCRTGDQIDDGLLREMLMLFIEENRPRIRTALAAAAHGSPLELRGAAHAIKGSAALIGADHLCDLAHDLECCVMSGAVNASSR